MTDIIANVGLWQLSHLFDSGRYVSTAAAAQPRLPPRATGIDWHRSAARSVPPLARSAAMGMPQSRVGDMHLCPMATPGTPPIPHVGGPVLPPGGIPVLVGGMPAARVGDMCVCVGPPDVIAVGSFTVLIRGQPAARIGDTTAHGGKLVVGCPTVLTG
jgi:uncharacterized Zn-binding protein involved in type VI secretion